MHKETTLSSCIPTQKIPSLWVLRVHNNRRPYSTSFLSAQKTNNPCPTSQRKNHLFPIEEKKLNLLYTVQEE